MVRGIEKFKEYFGDFPENYVIIGGTACDILMEDAGFKPRATKDIDLILIVEALSSEFVSLFWKFIQDGNYERQEKSNDERQYYRFMKPENKDYPHQIELFSRTPENVDLDEPSHLTPIPIDDDLSSLSAILLNDDYYNYMCMNTTVENGIRLANLDALICLKAKAFLEISERIEAGGKEDAKHLKKHKNDVFKLAAMLPGNIKFELPESIKKQLNEFLVVINLQLPDKAVFKDMGLPAISSELILKQLIKSFNLEEKYDFSMEIEELRKIQMPKIERIEKSKESVLLILENIYFPLLKKLDITLKGFDSLFKESTWIYFEEPQAPDYKTPLLPVSSNLERIVKVFHNMAKKGKESIHDFKTSYWLMDYKDAKQFGLEVAVKIHFLKRSYKIEIFIGQPFQSGKMLQLVANLIKKITKDDEEYYQFRKFDLKENEYDVTTVSDEELKAWIRNIRNQTLEVIKEKVK